MQIENIIKAIFDDLNNWRSFDEKIEYSKDMVLMGKNSSIDSLTFITFITDLEQRLSEHFSKEISLTDENALLEQPSPHKSVDNLIKYIDKISQR